MGIDFFPVSYTHLKEAEHAENYQAHERNDISGLLSKLPGQRHSQRHTNHITHFTHHQEQAGIQYQIEHPEIEECIGTCLLYTSYFRQTVYGLESYNSIPSHNILPVL